MKLCEISRRKFIITTLLATPCAVVADARWLEPQWVKTSRLRLSDKPALRFVHFSDLHHKGDRAHTKSVVDTINLLSPDFVCFTGDIVEDSKIFTGISRTSFRRQITDVWRSWKS
jgi:predicted MPP superfamily phosphohydrolase